MAHHDSLIGAEVAGHRIESLIGRGGMGSVYLAEQVGLGRRVALKILAPELAASENFRLRFERESRLAASLDHPHVVPIFQSGEADGVLFISMRYVDGTDLATLIATEGALPLEEAVALLTQVGSALDAAHARGLVHRDVKPGNVLLARGEPDEEPYAYLSDFGLTRLTSSESALTRTGQFMGTVAYAAPEQFEGRPADAMTDLYALGCVAYECLTGERPFPHEQEAAVMFGHLQQPPPAVTAQRPDAPDALDGVVARAMAKKPDDRFPSGKAMSNALRTAIGASATSGERAATGSHVAPAPPTVLPAPPEDEPGSAAAEPDAPPAPVGIEPPTSLPSRVTPPTPGSPEAPAPDGRRTPSRRRRGAVVAALVAVAVVAATVAVVVLAGSSGEPGTATSGGPSASATGGPSAKPSGAPPGVPIRVNTVAKLDPSTGRVLADYDVGSQPDSIAASGKAVWVINHDDVTISKIDTPTGHITTRGGFPSLCALSPGPDGAVWISECDQSQFVLVDPQSFEVVRTLHLPAPAAVVSAFDSLWAVSYGGSSEKSHLYRFTRAGRFLAKITLGLESWSLASQDGALWGNNHGDGTIWRVDPTTNQVRFLSGWTGPDHVVGSEGSLWISDDQDDSVTEYDAVREKVVGFVRENDGQIAVVPDTVWIQDGFSDILTKVDRSTDQVEQQFQLSYSSNMALGDGALWISAGSD